MEKDKIIEEMAKDIEKAKQHIWAGVRTRAEDEDYLWHSRAIAEHLMLQGYRKIPEGSVVLAKEEYENDFCSQFDKGYKIARKETAKKVLQTVKLRAWANNTDENGKVWNYCITSDELNEIAKQYGVEVEE